MEKSKDIPWPELLAKADHAIKKGATLYQKFTCENCGSRQTMDTPNSFYMQGVCEECKHVTDLVKNGGGYMATFSVKSEDVPDFLSERFGDKQ